MEKLMEYLKLPETTAECDIGPVLFGKPGSAFVAYDSPDEPNVTWTVLHFSGALASRVIPSIAVSVLAVDAYSKVCTVEDSVWLQELRGQAKRHRKVFDENLKHFIMYFDHNASIGVVAKSVSVKESNRLKRGQYPNIRIFD